MNPLKSNSIQSLIDQNESHRKMMEKISGKSTFFDLLKGMDKQLFFKEKNTASQLRKLTNSTSNIFNPLTAAQVASLSGMKDLENLSKSAAFQAMIIPDSLRNQLSVLHSSKLLFDSKLDVFFGALNMPKSNFAILNDALKSVSSTFLFESYKSEEWDEVEVFDQIGETIAKAVSEESFTDNRPVTLADFEAFKIEMISIAKKSKSEKIKTFIFDIMSIISFVVMIYQMFDQYDENKFQEIKKELIEELNIKSDNQKQIRIAKSKTKLYFSKNQRSKVLSQIKTGQNVTVLEVHKKWLLITYFDLQTNEPKCGFALKKWFAKLN
jgi:hypothetical protein